MKWKLKDSDERAQKEGYMSAFSKGEASCLGFHATTAGVLVGFYAYRGWVRNDGKKYPSATQFVAQFGDRVYSRWYESGFTLPKERSLKFKANIVAQEMLEEHEQKYGRKARR